MRAIPLLLAAIACVPPTSMAVPGAPELIDAFYVQDPAHFGEDTLTEVWLTSFDDSCEALSRVSSLLARGRVDEATTAWTDHLPADAWYFVASIRSTSLVEGASFAGTAGGEPPRESEQAQGVLVHVTGAPDLEQGIPLTGEGSEGGSLEVTWLREERIAGAFDMSLLGEPTAAQFDATWCRAVEEPRFRD